MPTAPDLLVYAELRYRGTGQALEAADLLLPTGAGRCHGLSPPFFLLVTDLERGLRALGVPFAVIGALVPELLLDVRPVRMTNDADVTVAVESLADFEALKDRLSVFGFTRTTSRTGCGPPHQVDASTSCPSVTPLLQAGVSSCKETAPQHGRLRTRRAQRHRHGDRRRPDVAVDSAAALRAPQAGGISDRTAPKDLAGVFHCLQHYLEDDERRTAPNTTVPACHLNTPARTAGRRWSSVPRSAAASETIARVLDRFVDSDAEVVATSCASRAEYHRGRGRLDVFEHFRGPGEVSGCDSRRADTSPNTPQESQACRTPACRTGRHTRCSCRGRAEARRCHGGVRGRRRRPGSAGSSGSPGISTQARTRPC